MSASMSKRKFEDPDDEDSVFSSSPTKMRKDLPSSSNSASSPHSTAPISNRIQFFVRILSQHTLVLQASPDDTVRKVHEKIQSITGISAAEQRLLYRGKQLQCDQTLAQSRIQKDGTLHLVGRMRSTGYPKAWGMINDLVGLVFHRVRNNTHPPPQSKTIKSLLLEFLSLYSARNLEQPYGYLQVFNLLSAPAALVMLYTSSHKADAEEAIRCFLSSSKTVLPLSAHHQFMPILLEFCRLLNNTAGISDQLYCYCRSTLGEMLGHVPIGGKKTSFGLSDVSPFVSELAAKISNNLRLCEEPILLNGLGLVCSDIKDFSRFLKYVKNVIKGDDKFCGPIEAPLHLPMRRNANEISMLRVIFVDLFSKLQKSLAKIEEVVGLDMKQDAVILPGGRIYFLDILKELHGISELYHGGKEMFWEAMKQRKCGLCYLIINYAKGAEENLWITECKEVMNFEARRHLALLMLPDVKDDYDELHEMLIDRLHLLEESFEYIAHVDATALRSGLFMEFKNEEATGPGVLREWFSMVCQSIFNPQNALFLACPNDRRRFFPNPASKVDPLHLEYFTFSGRMIALALMHKIQVGIVFDRVFFLQLAGHEITFEDVKDADPCLYKSCKQILEMDPDVIDQDVLGLTFIDEIEELGKKKVVKLHANGEAMVVNSANRKEYVDSLIKKRFVSSVVDQVYHFSQGFADVMSSSHLQRCFFQLLDLQDLDWMLHGSEGELSVDDWKAHTKYQGFKETDAQISWFWEVVGRMSPEQRRILLYFWTSVKYLPIKGFGGLASRLYIYKTFEPVDHLPTSHTCFFQLCFPSYPSITVMEQRLGLITQDHIGCSFGTS